MRRCENRQCGKALVRRTNESQSNWGLRKFCCKSHSHNTQVLPEKYCDACGVRLCLRHDERLCVFRTRRFCKHACHQHYRGTLLVYGVRMHKNDLRRILQCGTKKLKTKTPEQ